MDKPGHCNDLPRPSVVSQIKRIFKWAAEFTSQLYVKFSKRRPSLREALKTPTASFQRLTRE